MVSAAEKYAFEIEIFTFGRDYWTQISRSSVQKGRFNQSRTRPFERIDCFQQNRPISACREGQETALKRFYTLWADSCLSQKAGNNQHQINVSRRHEWNVA